jgi:branched-chain amino acid transport system ATP-binding protein
VIAQPVLECLGLSAGYGGQPVIRDLDLRVEHGEVVALLGANGAGKTTTILSLCGELAPLGGEVRWLGRATRSTLTQRTKQGLALVPEEKSVFMGLTVAENLRLGRGDPSAALKLFPELSEHMNRKAGLLSGGQQQFVTVARALASSPRVLLADELSLGLAPLIVERLMLALRAAADEGVGVLLVEQHVRSALAIADRAYVLRRGRCVLEGDALDLRGRIGEIEASYLSGDHAAD